MINPFPQGTNFKIDKIKNVFCKIKKTFKWIFYDDFYKEIRFGWHVFWIVGVVIGVVISFTFIIVYFCSDATYYAKIMDGDSKEVYELHDCEAFMMSEHDGIVEFEKDGTKYKLSNYMIETKEEKYRDFAKRKKNEGIESCY